MAGIEGLMKGLKEPQWDVMVQVMNDLQDSTSHERMDSLRQFLATVAREIDQINRKRDVLGQKVANIDAFTPAIDEYLRSHPADLETILFKSVLLGWKAALKTEIAEMRPNGKLEKKYDTERKRDLLVEVQRLVLNLNGHMDAIRKSSALVPPPVAPTHTVTTTEPAPVVRAK